MKKHLAVLAIASRTIWQVLVVILLTAAVQTAIFTAMPAEWTERYDYMTQDGPVTQEVVYTLCLEEVFDKGHIGLVAAVGFVVMCGLLCFKTSGYGSRVQYTVARLGVREETLNLWWMAYHTVCMILFWMSQFLVTWLLCQIFLGRAEPTQINGQTVVLAYYRQPYLHNLMPGADVARWARNCVLVLMMGASLSYFAMVQRRGGRISFVTLACVAMAVFLFRAPVYSKASDALLLLLLGVLAALLIRLLTAGQAEREREEAQT